MHFKVGYTILILLSVLGIKLNTFVSGKNNDLVTPRSLVDHDQPARSLRAARMDSNIRARSIEGCLGHGFDLYYLDGKAQS